jgi:hypothetical protein
MFSTRGDKRLARKITSFILAEIQLVPWSLGPAVAIEI